MWLEDRGSTGANWSIAYDVAVILSKRPRSWSARYMTRWSHHSRKAATSGPAVYTGFGVDMQSDICGHAETRLRRALPSTLRYDAGSRPQFDIGKANLDSSFVRVISTSTMMHETSSMMALTPMPIRRCGHRVLRSPDVVDRDLTRRTQISGLRSVISRQRYARSELGSMTRSIVPAWLRGA
nr:hypothetical protein CFP56_71739 [Quercus suber]